MLFGTQICRQNSWSSSGFELAVSFVRNWQCSLDQQEVDVVAGELLFLVVAYSCIIAFQSLVNVFIDCA